MKKNKSLLILACGDSYGSDYEYDGLKGKVFDIDTLPNESLNKIITDDTKMANILLKHYNYYKIIKLNILLDTYKQWATIDGLDDGIGIHTYNVLINNQEDKDSQGNGALMRNIPFGLEIIKDGYSFEDTIAMMNIESSLTHKNETIFISNRLALDLAINGVDVLNKLIYKDIISKLEYGHTAWVIHSLYIVIEALKKDLEFIDAFKYIVSLGGDTDTNCAIYGAIKSFISTEDINYSDFLTNNSIDYLQDIRGGIYESI